MSSLLAAASVSSSCSMIFTIDHAASSDATDVHMGSDTGSCFDIDSGSDADFVEDADSNDLIGLGHIGLRSACWADSSQSILTPSYPSSRHHPVASSFITFIHASVVSASLYHHHLIHLKFANTPTRNKQRHATATPVNTSIIPSTITHPHQNARRCFRLWRLSQESLYPSLSALLSSVLLVGVPYVCFAVTLTPSFDVSLCSVSLLAMPFSSSMCTAIEKRRQNAGSRTAAIAAISRVSDWFVRSFQCGFGSLSERVGC